MIQYDDLLQIPYKRHGRDKKGMDCYGLVIECTKRQGNPLRDIIYDRVDVPENEKYKYLLDLNVREIPSQKIGCIVQYQYKGNLHIGFIVSKNRLLHMSFSGCYVQPLFEIGKCKFYEVIND